MAYDANKVNQGLAKRAQGLGPNARARRQFGGPLYRRPRWKEPEEYQGWKQAQDQNTENFLGNWDYRNADKRGPQGEQLPPGAEAWTPNGEAYYGDGLPGWWKGFLAKLQSPYAEQPTEIAAYKPITGYHGGVSGAGQGLDIFQTLKNGWNSVAQTETPIGALFRGLQEGAKSGIQALGEPAKKTEQVFGVGQAIADVERQKQIAGGEIRTPYGFVVKRDDPRWEEYFKKFAPPTTPWDTTNLRKTAEMGYQAGRIFYSTALDPIVREEFYKRYQAGENPYFLQQELENPGAELVGQLVFDPLNLIGTGVTKPFAQSMRERNISAKLFNVAPEIRDFLKGADAITEAGNVNMLERAVEVQRAVSARTAQGLVDMAMPLGGRTLRTSSAKQFVLGQEFGEFEKWLYANHNIEDATDTLEAMVKLHGSPDEVADAMAFARSGKNLAPQTMFSETGQKIGYVLRRMLTDADGKITATKFFEDVTKAANGAPDELVKLISAKMDNAIGGMFPSVGEMRAAAQKAKGGRAMTATEKAWATKYNQLSPAIKSVASVGERMSKAYKIPNSFFAGVYMGYNPGYAFRNWTQNSLQIAIDQGIGALLVRDPEAKVMALLGGVKPSGIGGFSKGTAGVETLDLAHRAPMSALADKMEAFGSAQVAYASVRRTLRKALQPGRALPDLRGLVDAGLSEQAARRFSGMIWEHNGDVAKATTAFLDQLKTGEVDLYRTLDWINKNDLDALEGFNKSDQVLDVLRNAENPDDAAARLDAIWDEMRRDGDNVANDVPAVTEDAVGLEHAVADNDLPAAEQALIHNHYQANDNAFSLHYQAVENAARGNPELQSLLDQTVRATTDLHAQARAFGDRWNPWWARIKAASGRGEALDLPKLWRETGMTSAPPTDWATFSRRFWEEFYYPSANDMYVQSRDLWETATANVKRLAGENNMTRAADEASALAKQYDELAVNFPRTEFQLQDAIAGKRPRTAINILAERYGVPSATEAGVPMDKRILDMINKYLPEGAPKYASLDDIRIEDIPEIEAAFARRVSAKAGVGETVATKLPAAVKPPVPYAGNMVTPARILHESKQGLEELLTRLKAGAAENWGRTAPTGISRDIERAVAKWAQGAERGVAESRLLAANVADADRAFTLLSYPDKTYLDLAMAFVYPYQFWYSRTYAHWLQRIATEPQVLAGYTKYRDYLEKIHAGAPDWWKYNINSNEVLGIQSDNPLFFNLEATLNPLNGITGVDFTDPYKRVNWWTKALDDMNKLGPSTFTPFSLAAALALKMQGQDDAAARWGGRLLPQTATIKSALNLLNVNIPTGQGIDEFDPSVYFFSNGLDPYERRRAGRALGWMIDEGEVSQADAIEAARTQSGPVWEEAVRRAIRQRAGGQLASFFLGTGFKSRNASDIEIDRFDSEWRKLWNMSDNLSADEFRLSMENLRTKYPFMDTVLLSRKGGDERDRSYVYNVLGRIPPGQKEDIATLAGIDPRLMDQFYENKGDMSAWAATDRQKFMAGMVDIGAILDLPDEATRLEWNDAKTRYSQMQEEAKTLFGEDIWDRVDAYYAAKGSGAQRTEADAILEADPQIGEVLDWKAQQTMNDETLRQYYMSIDNVERYYKGLMYNLAEKQFGEDIWDIQDGYFNAKMEGKQSQYLKQHPELIEYWDMKDQYSALFAASIARTAQYLKEPTFPNLRTEEGLSIGQQDILGGLQNRNNGVYDYTWQDWQARMSAPLERLVLDYVENGEKLNYAAQDQLEYIASQENIDPDIMLQLIEQSLYDNMVVSQTQ